MRVASPSRARMSCVSTGRSSNGSVGGVVSRSGTPGERRTGRPRKPATDQAIIQATIALLVEGGTRAATVDAIARRSGRAKTTIYRRWPSRDALLLDAFRYAVQGTSQHVEEVGELDRALGSTIRGAAYNILALVQSRLFRAAFPTMARELLAGTPLGDRFRAQVFQPIRGVLRERLRAEIAPRTVRAEADLDLVFDLVNGGMLYRAVVGEPIDEYVADAISEIVLRGAMGEDPPPR